MTMISPGQPAHWNPNASKYKCCCSCCHVKSGAIAIGIVTIVFSSLNLISGILGIAGGAASNAIGTLIGALLAISLAALMLYGLTKEIPNFVLPFLIFQAISLLFTVLLFIGVVVAALAAKDSLVDYLHSTYNTRDSGQGTAVYGANGSSYLDSGAGRAELEREDVEAAFTSVVVMVTLTTALSIGVSVWLFLVVLKAYRFLRDKREFASLQPPPSMSVGYSMAQYPSAVPPPPPYGQPPQGYGQGYGEPQGQPPAYGQGFDYGFK